MEEGPSFPRLTGDLYELIFYQLLSKQVEVGAGLVNKRK